ncbi:MAG: ABC transporter permease, partial [Bdellovibrionaceae bacterium]|nr:ABC transporter permease [Pseudobdellovibrionaceae bacterium]
SFSYLFLPSLSLALPLGAVLMKITRASILEVLSSDYVRTARSKGLSLSQVYFKHVLKNALIPILTVLGLQMGSLLTGTVIVETIFDRPGIGSLLYQSIVSRDYPLVQALVLLIAFLYIFINWLTDWLYTVFNPFMESS